MSDIPSGRSPRRELQGPRPTPLKVHKDSHKIKKPPIPPHNPHAPPYNPHAPPRPPVIIYTVSPKIIHANPNEFMSLVQRLTGRNSSSCSSSTLHTNSPSTSSSARFGTFQENSGAISPAARFASIENTKSLDGRKAMVNFYINDNDTEKMMEGMEIGREVQRTGQFPGILSPNPNTLPPIPPNFFSPPSENNNPFNFFHDLSPGLHSNRNNNYSLDNNFNLMPSPSLISPQMYMPSPNTLDLFNSLFDP